ncbi:MAG: Xaa-His dipeptidase, partial [Sulfurospirillaceae bacterium]|nr:Xaa-His dipeptidase [Sulfurospirillaceae bacterium]
MQKIMEHFMEITSLPRCSQQAHKMKDYIKTFALGLEYEVFEDSYGNVLCRRGEPKICLQAHYDMVCIGDTSSIELVREHNVLKAKNSTLGADNGMGMALMFQAMEENNDLECLFTADEEIGLIGASHFDMPLVSTRLLNLDSEQEGEVCIGCAGGVDIIATLDLTYEPLLENEVIYKISALDFPGGHSGVDIDKNIPSAIKVLAHELSHHNIKLISIGGGERRNSIAKSAVAFVASAEPFDLKDERLQLSPTQEIKIRKSFSQSAIIIKILNAFAQGVREWDSALGIPSTSINLGVITHENDLLR